MLLLTERGGGVVRPWPSSAGAGEEATRVELKARIGACAGDWFPLFFGVQTLWSVGETTAIMTEEKRERVLLSPAIEQKVKEYEKELDAIHGVGGGCEYMKEEEFIEFLRVDYDESTGKGAIYDLAEITEKRARRIFQAVVDRVIVEGYRNEGSSI